MYYAYYYPYGYVVPSTVFGNGALGPGIGVPQGPGQVAFASTIYSTPSFAAAPAGWGNYSSGPVKGIGGKK